MTRTRTANHESAPLIFTIFDAPPGSVVETQNWGTLNGYQTITDVSTPGYSFLKRKGAVILSPVTIERFSFEMSSDRLVASGPPAWGTRTWEGPMAYMLVPDAPEDSSALSDVATAQQSVVNEVYAKAYDGTAQLGVTIGEGNETLRTIRKPLGRARNILEQMIYRKHTLLNKGVGAAKAIASTWLEYRLGWKPIVYDIQNIMDATAKHLVGNKTTERQVARSSKMIETYIDKELALTPPYYRFHSGVGRSTKSVSYKVSAGVIYETRILSDDGIVSEKVRHNYGLQLRDVARTGWELVPLSFVVDRFVQVGTWLSAIQPNPNVSILGSWMSTKRSAHGTRQVLNLTVNTTPPAVTGPSGLFTGRNVMLTRVVGVVPSVIPTLNVGDLSLSQHVDHVSLLLSKFVDFRRKS